MPLSSRVALGAAVLATLQARPARAQPAEAPERTSAAVEVHLGGTRLADVLTPIAGAAALIGVRPWLRVGAGAWSSLQRVDGGTALSDSGLDLGFGYGGVLVEAPLPRIPVSLRLLVGGGAATLRSIAVGSRFDTETFAVVEPALVVDVRLLGPLRVGAMGAYRRVAGANAIFLIDNGDLSGVWASAFVRIGGF